MGGNGNDLDLGMDLDLGIDRDDIQDMRGDLQDSVNNRQDARLAELSAIQLEPAEVAANPAAQPASPNQRLRLHVPSVRTDLAMGAKGAAGTVRAGMPNCAGFGVSTDGDIFMDALKKVALQANEDICVQSETANVWVGAGDSLTLASIKGAGLTGGGGVLIAGGAGMGYAPRYSITEDAVPAAPKWNSGWGDLAGALNRVAGLFDAGLGIAMAMKTKAISRCGSTNKVLFDWPTLIGVAISTVGAGLGATTSPDWANFNGTTVYGTGGLINATPGTMGIYSGAGTCIAGGLGLSLLSPIAISAMAKKLDFAAGSTVALKAGDSSNIEAGTRLELAARGGKASLLGKEIAIGTWPQANSVDPQKATLKLKMLAQDMDIAAKDHDLTVFSSIKHFGTDFANTGTGYLKIAADYRAGLVAKVGVVVACSENASTLEVDKRGWATIYGMARVHLKAGKDVAKNEVLAEAKGEIKIDFEKKVEIKADVDSIVRLSNRGVLIRKGETQLSVKSDKASINGSKIMIG